MPMQYYNTYCRTAGLTTNCQRLDAPVCLCHGDDNKINKAEIALLRTLLRASAACKVYESSTPDLILERLDEVVEDEVQG